MLSQAIHVLVTTGTRQDRGIAGRDGPPSLSFQGSSDNHGTTVGPAISHETVDEIDDVLGEANRDLLAHPKRYPCGMHSLPAGAKWLSDGGGLHGSSR